MALKVHRTVSDSRGPLVKGSLGFLKTAAIQKDKSTDATPGKMHEITLNRKASQ